MALNETPSIAPHPASQYLIQHGEHWANASFPGGLNDGQSNLTKSFSVALTLKSISFPDQIFLRSTLDGHKASIDSKSILSSFRGNVVMRDSAIPNDKIARVGANLDPLETFVVEPLHAILSETIPFRCPGRNALLVLHVFMELGGQTVTASANNKTTIIRTTRIQINKALKTSEARLRGILILMWPWFVLWQVLSVGKPHVYNIERYDQIGIIINLLERFNDTRLAPNIPDPLLMSNTVVKNHPFFIDNR